MSDVCNSVTNEFKANISEQMSLIKVASLIKVGRRKRISKNIPTK